MSGALSGAGLAAGPRRPRPAPAPGLIRRPSLLGSGLIGAAVAVDPGVWSGAAQLAFRWLRDGAPIIGATGETYAPGPADDRAALACRVAAGNAAGRTIRETPAITITFPAPRAVGAPPDFQYTQFTGSHTVDASPFFSGSSLSFSVAGDGVVVDPATGLVTIDATSLETGVTVVVTAANSGGQAEASFRFKVSAAEPAGAAPALVAPPALTGTGLVGEALTVDPGGWSGDPAPSLTLQWLDDGAPVAGAVEPRFVPGADRDGAKIACRVTARNAAGEATAVTPAKDVTHAAPVATGTLADLALALGGAARVVDAAKAFTGAALRFAVEGAGATIDAKTGVLTLSAATPRAAQTVTVTATNSGGAARKGFALTVLAAPDAIGAAGSVVIAQAAGSRSLAMKPFFAGGDLVYALAAAPSGVTIDAKTGSVTVPTGTAREGVLRVRASNALGGATLSAPLTVATPPGASGAPKPIAFATAPGARSVSAQAYFTGSDLVYSLGAAPAGVRVNPGSGLVTVPTAAAMQGAIALRATNAAGTATQSLSVTVGGPEPIPAATTPAAALDAAWSLDQIMVRK